MKIESHEEFPEIKIIENFHIDDGRGEFVKLFNCDSFLGCDLDFTFREVYYSVSKKNVVRGMHFQTPPWEHEKIIHVVRGKVMDVITDLRKSSPNYKRSMCVLLTGNVPKSIYIPKGFAHGFRCYEDNTIMLYSVSSVYHAEHDCGIRWNSLDIDWNITEPIISMRDSAFITLDEFDSPFI